MQKQNKNWKKDVGHEVGRFGVHVLEGFLKFLIILAAAFLMGWLKDQAAAFIHDPYIVTGLGWAERVLFTADMVFLLLWLVYSARVEFKNLS